MLQGMRILQKTPSACSTTASPSPREATREGSCSHASTTAKHALYLASSPPVGDKRIRGGSTAGRGRDGSGVRGVSAAGRGHDSGAVRGGSTAGLGRNGGGFRGGTAAGLGRLSGGSDAGRGRCTAANNYT
ncbi:hypothetical protein E2562_029273 [Oryza meyeriana var. granulata]|uniref:Uncharacterized protein n=1 Tax=Oryza meyeriana var. granulata TaxID=110450 RepID=A0A6G1BNP7_9ORYZ|nr:hypothetical protein E2562_029273 [Oryza meyeriana var. granulata]